jgi:hypothetical protein
LSEALDFYILYGGYWFLIRAKDYISTYDSCRVCITREDNGKWIIGNALMRGYYSVFNLSSLKFGMTPTSISTKPLVKAGTIPDKTARPFLWEYVGIGVGTALTAVSSYLIWQYANPDP